MKKINLLVVLFVSILFIACSKDDDNDDTTGGGGSGKTYCWVFTIKQVTSISGTSIPGYPQTTTTTVEQCGLTETQAETVCKNGTTSTTSTIEGISVTVKTTTTKNKK